MRTLKFAVVLAIAGIFCAFFSQPVYAAIGKSYSFTLTATGTAPITWTASGLPSGLNRNSNGYISGTVSSSGGNFDVLVSASNNSNVTAQKHLTLKVTNPGIAVDAANFPDNAFRSYVNRFDTDKDGYLSETEIAKVTYIYVSYKNISSLEGIEHFTALTYLYCGDNKLTTLDVSNNTKLTYLDCGGNELLTALDVSKNTELTYLYCFFNRLTALDVSKNTKLTHLHCSNNQLTVLDVSNNTALTHLYCYFNRLMALDVSNNTALTSLYCYFNRLMALDVSKNTKLTHLDCEGNKLTKLDVSNNTALTHLYCGGGYHEDYCNQLTALDVSKNTKLTYLDCYGNELTKLDVSKNTKLTYLDCSFNQLTALDVSRNTALTSLHCYFNRLMALDVSRNTALTSLHCERNKLATLDVSKNTKLTDLDCGFNQLTALDVSNNIKLTDLDCGSNQLTALDVSQNTKFITFRINGQYPRDMLKISKHSSDVYTVNLGDYTSGNISRVSDVHGHDTNNWTIKTEYDHSTGIAKFAVSPAKVSYKYDTQYAQNTTDRYLNASVILPSKPVIINAELPEAEVNKSYEFTLTATGNTPMTWEIVSNDLPDGLTLEETTGKISGYPVKAGSFDFTVMAQNSAGRDTREFVIVVKAEPPVITTETLSDGKVGKKYNAALSATGIAPITWTVVSGALPNGLKLVKTTGKINGTPTKVGTFTFTVGASNEAGSCRKEFTITILNPMIVTGSFASPAYLNRSYSSYVTVSGGTPPYTVSKYSGTLPTGLKLSVSGNKIYLKGKPTKVETFKFKLKITDSKGESIITPQYTIKVTGPVVSGSFIEEAYLNSAYSSTITITNGTQPYQAVVLKGSLPEGIDKVAVSKKNVTLSGKPTKPGEYKFTLRITDKNKAYVDIKDIPIKVTGPVIGKTAFSSSASVNEPYTSSINVSGGTERIEATLQSGKLPNGLNLSYASGKVTLSGTPTKAGTFNFKVKVTDANGGNDISEQQTINVTGLAVEGKFKTPGYLNVKYSSYITVSGGTPKYTVSKYSGTLPTGLELSVEGDKIYLKGKPTKTGTFKFKLKVTDSKGAKLITDKFTVKITGPSIDYDFSDGYVDVSYDDHIIINGGTKPYKAAKTKGTLPNGLKLSVSGNKVYLKGTPTKAGKYTFTIKVTDKNGANASKEFTVKIKYLELEGEFMDGVRGAKYSDYIEVMDGSEPYKVTKTKGTLPNGLKLSVSGNKVYLKGTPKKAGKYTFTLEVTDADGAYAVKQFKVVITQTTIIGELPGGQLKNPYSATLKASGGTEPYTWEVSDGKLPTGLSISYSGSGNTLTVSGTPTKTGTFKFEITAKDKNGITDTKSYKIEITKTAINGTLSAGTVGKSYTGTLKATGGAEPYKWTVSKGSLPPGLNLNASTGEITGKPTEAGKYSFTIKATDKNKIATTKAFKNVTINAAAVSTVSSLPQSYEDALSFEEEEYDEHESEKYVPENVTNSPEYYSDADGALAVYKTELHVISDDVLKSYEGKDSDLVSVRASMPVTFVLGEWVKEDGSEVEVYNMKVYIDDESAEYIKILEGTFTLPAEIVHDDFKVCVKAKAGDSELESEEVYVSAE